MGTRGELRKFRKGSHGNPITEKQRICVRLGGTGSCLGNLEERSSGQVGASIQVEAHTGVVAGSRASVSCGSSGAACRYSWGHGMKGKEGEEEGRLDE